MTLILADVLQQPTSFWLHTHSIDHVFGNADLITSLSGYPYARHDQLSSEDIISLQARKPPKSTAAPTTTLFLQVFAMADYYSLDTDLMEHVPPVAVDVILDPFILNVLPRSLLPTGLYLVLIAVGAWLLSGWVSKKLTARSPDGHVVFDSKKPL